MKNITAKILAGRVVACRLPKTVTVEVSRLVKHPRYGKLWRRSKRYLAHDDAGGRRIGDPVRIAETRPYSRRKHFKII